MSGKKASMPGPGYAKKASPGGRIQGLTLKVAPETGKPVMVDFSNLAGTETLRLELLTAVAALTGSTGSWTSDQTIRSASTPMRILLSWCANAGIEEFSQLTPASWNDLLIHLGEMEAQGNKGAFQYRTIIRLLAREIAEVPAATKKLARRRHGSPAPGETKSSYTMDEFIKIREAAWRVVKAAHERVWENYLHALQHEANNLAPEDDPVGQALLETLKLGVPSARAGYVALGATYPRTRPGGRPNGSHVAPMKARRMLFTSGPEASAAAVLMCCLEGLNKSVIANRKVPESAAGLGDFEVALTVTDDKPRRGPKLRYSVTTLTQNPGNAVQVIREMTDPIRDHLARKGERTNQLLVLWGDKPSSGIPQDAEVSWWPEGVPNLDFRRLRRTVINHVRKEPIGHTAETWVADYRGLDEDLRGHALRAASRAAEEYEVAASVFFKGKLQAESDAAQDTVLGGCADFSRHPDSGTECQDSFLNCLGCANVVITPRHLPFQVAMLDALDEVSTLRLDDWEEKFAIPFARLKALLTDGSLIPTEAVKSARQSITGEHLERVRSLLGGRYRS